VVLGVVAPAHRDSAAKDLDRFAQAAARAQHDSVFDQTAGVLMAQCLRLFDIISRAIGIAQRDSCLRAADQRFAFGLRNGFLAGKLRGLGETAFSFAQARLDFGRDNVAGIERAAGQFAEQRLGTACEAARA
jgi:hypothetical protein